MRRAIADRSSAGVELLGRRLADERLVRDRRDGAVVEESREEVLADVARPEGAVAVDGDRAAGLACDLLLEQRDDLRHGDRFHGSIIHGTLHAMDRGRRVRVSKLLSFGLRHDPTALGLSLDSAGWAAVETVLAGLAARGELVTREELAEVVATSDKKRFALSDDGARIRASQGHSVDVDLGLPPREPPETLFHGTSEHVVSAIRQQGLLPGSRTHVHLSADVRTAEIVAKRREGPIAILRVRAAAMHAAGRAFFLSENGVWLTEHVPPEFLEAEARAHGQQ